MVDKRKKFNQIPDNISTRIAKEEHFVSASELKKDPNAIYIEDSPQKALEKLLSLSTNQNYPEKLQYVKHLAELLELIGPEAIDKLKSIIAFACNDKDEIKRALLSQMSQIIGFLQKNGEKGYKEILNVLVPTISKLTDSMNYDIKEECGQVLAKIAGILNADDRGKHLLTIVLGMAHDDENEENRMIAVRLLSQMAPLFGKDLCEQFVGLEFLSMGEDPQLRVRKEAVSNLSSIGKIVSPHFFRQRLLPFYLKLCKDNNWGVRKSCIDIIYDISQICDVELAEIRENELTEMILNFLKDSNKWVKISAYKNLGPFISTLQGLRVNEKLVENYISMSNSSVNNLAPENEIIHACSYNFPAVVLTLGPSRWPSLLKLFQALVRSNDMVKKPLACGLHEIARIIGEERAESDLLYVLELFLRDSNDDIKFGAIQNLALFLKVFHIDKREHMIDIFLNLQKDQKKWRIRELIAMQIDKLTIIFSPEIIFRIIAPISFKLCNDPVAFVREEAAKKIHAIVKALYNSEEIYRDSVIENIKGFSQSNRYTNRQAFASMCEKLMKYSDIFKAHFLENMLPLADDKVPNVRISLAKALQKAFNKQRQICNDPQVIELVKKLQSDKSKDVLSFVLPIKLPDLSAIQNIEHIEPVEQHEPQKQHEHSHQDKPIEAEQAANENLNAQVEPQTTEEPAVEKEQPVEKVQEPEQTYVQEAEVEHPHVHEGAVEKVNDVEMGLEKELEKAVEEVKHEHEQHESTKVEEGSTQVEEAPAQTEEEVVEQKETQVEGAAEQKEEAPTQVEEAAEQKEEAPATTEIEQATEEQNENNQENQNESEEKINNEEEAAPADSSEPKAEESS